jgi:hypothetical protein
VTWSLHTRINNAVLIALCAKSELDRGFHMYRSTRTRSISTEPATFHLLVESFSKTNNTENAALVVLDMLSERCIPERETWDVVISGYWSKKKVRQEVEQTWNQLAIN